MLKRSKLMFKKITRQNADILESKIVFTEVTINYLIPKAVTL